MTQSTDLFKVQVPGIFEHIGDGPSAHRLFERLITKNGGLASIRETNWRFLLVICANGVPVRASRIGA